MLDATGGINNGGFVGAGVGVGGNGAANGDGAGGANVSALIGGTLNEVGASITGVVLVALVLAVSSPGNPIN